MPSDPDKFPLTQALTALRHQLKIAAEQAQGLGPDEIRFGISDIELELTIAAEDSTTVDGEIGWWIFKAKAGLAAKDVVTHKVKLKLNAGDIEVASKTDTDWSTSAATDEK